jgi:hypothetical protein
MHHDYKSGSTVTAYMDWPWIEPEYGKYDLEFANYWLGVDELNTGGMRIRTNSFFGMGDEMPPFWRNVPYDEFLERVYEHVSATVKRFAPSVDNWEAFAEPNFGNHNPLNLTKSEYYEVMATAIRAIRDNDPTCPGRETPSTQGLAGPDRTVVETASM